MSVIPPGETMNTDQRLALLLTHTQATAAEELNRLRAEYRYWKDQPGGEAMAEVVNRQRVHIANAGERLEEIVKALAAGTLRIVDDSAVVRVLAKEFEVPTEAPDTTRRAQLALEQLTFSQAIR